MKINKLRKIYPSLLDDMKNVKWRRLTDAEFDKSIKEPQIIANCYDEATRYALLASKKGREIFRNRIWIQKNSTTPAYKLKININGKEEFFRTNPQDYWGKYSNITTAYWNNDPFKYKRLSLGVNIAVNKMVEKHPFMKPLISRFYMFGLCENNGCEYNIPSNAFKWYTGKQPKSIGEKGLNINLKKYKDEVYNELNKLKNKSSKKYSYVAMTGPLRAYVTNTRSNKVKVDGWHCLPILKVNKEKQIILKDLRTREVIKISYEDFIKKFKGLIGLDY